MAGALSDMTVGATGQAHPCPKPRQKASVAGLYRLLPSATVPCSPLMHTSLPIDALLDAFDEAGHRVVVSAPTGSGKSTRVPTWCKGKVLVVEPRRLACRALASRVAELEGARVGGAIGYHVRDDKRWGEDTRIVLATPGIVLRGFDDVARYDTVILDELHERRLDTDLLLAMLSRDYAGRLLAMSATLDGERVASYLEGVHLAGKGRLFPVDVRHVAGGALLPERDGLEQRLLLALDQAANDAGDVLVFLPGKAEIAAAAESLRGRTDLTAFALHGGLSLDEQSRAFSPTNKRKVLLATNVAETSITVPGIGVVIDGGLVRQTRYHSGRGFLTLAPIAMDSAEQRAGRAGRTGPGVCYRLWSEAAVLAKRTAPEMHRMSLVPLVLAASACGWKLEDLTFLDAPKPQAAADAHRELMALEAMDAQGALTSAGRELFGLPLDAHLGRLRLLVEARRRGTLDDMVDLVAALAVGRPLFVARPEYEEDDLRAAGCDAVALIRAVRIGRSSTHGLSRFALAEARRYGQRLRRALKLESPTDDERPIDREALALMVLAADPRAAHVARRRKARVAWANGGTELTLARESAANKKLDETDAILVLESRAFGVGKRDARVLATAAMPVPLRWLVDAGLGRERVAKVERGKRSRVVATVERVYAKRVIATEERVPEGALAREAIRDLYLRGSVFKEGLRRCKENLETRALAVGLSKTAAAQGWDLSEVSEAPPTLEEWVLTRLEDLGMEHGSDLRMLSADDLVADPLPEHLRALLDKEYPRKLEVGGATYAVDYDLDKRQVLLRIVRGNRKDPPPRSWLPRFTGFKICVEAGRRIHVLR